MPDQEPIEGNVQPEGGRNEAPTPPPGVPQSAGPFSNPYIPPTGGYAGTPSESGEPAGWSGVGAGPDERGNIASDGMQGGSPFVEQQGALHQSDDRSAPQWGAQPSGDERDDPANGSQLSSGLFGPNGRWLWFAGGVLFAIFGVLIALLFNMGRSASVRNEAVKYAAWGLLVGVIIELLLMYALGGVDAFYSLLGYPTGSSSSGSVF